MKEQDKEETEEKEGDLVPQYFPSEFDIDADDSSDEETTAKNIKSYDIDTKWQEYAASRTTLDEKDSATKQGFVIHAYGMKLLYSEGTNRAYYLLKKTNLGKNQISNDAHWFYFSLEQIFNEIYQKFCSLIPNITFQLYRKQYDTQVEEWAQRLRKLTRPLLLWLKGKPITQELSALLNEIFQTYYNFFCSFLKGQEKLVIQLFVARETCRVEVKNAIDFIRQRYAGYNFQRLLNSYTTIDINLRRILEQYALEEAVTYLRNLGGLNGNTLFAINKAPRKKLAFTPNARFPLLGDYTKKWYKHDNFYGSTRVDNYLKEENHLKELVVAMIFDFALTPVNETNIHEQAYKEFTSLCAKHLTATRDNPLYRPTIERSLLPSTFTLQSPSPYAFFANLRLSQRDMKRRQKQLLDEQDNKNEVLMGSSYSRAWKFNSRAEALETQELTANQDSKMFSRNDKIINFGNYAEISSEMSALTSMINCSLIITNAAGLPRTSEQMITDAKIAAWVRKTLQGHNIAEELVGYRLLPGHLKKLETFIVNLTQLLFGCEGSRNPASFILHQMVLDLVIYANYPWNQMFCETLGQNQFNQPQTNIRLMPMAMKKAVPSSRILHNKFMNFMPHPYQYFGSEQDEKSYDLLKTRYPMLINTWLTYYLKNPQENLEQAIEHSLERWYGISALHLGFNKK